MIETKPDRGGHPESRIGRRSLRGRLPSGLPANPETHIVKTAKLVRLFIGHVAKLEDAAGKEICDLELQALRRAAALEGGLHPTGELLPLCQRAIAEFNEAFTPAWVELRNLAPDLTAELERLRSLHDQAVRYYRAYADGDSCEGPHPVEIASVVHSEWRPRLAWLSQHQELAAACQSETPSRLNGQTDADAAIAIEHQPGPPAGSGTAEEQPPAVGFLSYRKLAGLYGIPKGKLSAFKVAIQRWRDKNPDGCGSTWIERESGGTGGERYLYKAESVMDIINRYRPK